MNTMLDLRELNKIYTTWGWGIVHKISTCCSVQVDSMQILQQPRVELEGACWWALVTTLWILTKSQVAVTMQIIHIKPLNVN